MDMNEVFRNFERTLHSGMFKEGDRESSSVTWEWESTPPPEDDTSEAPTTVEDVYSFEDYSKHVLNECIDVDDETDPASTPFIALKKKMLPLTEDGGVMKQIIRSGSSKVFAEGIVEYHYNSYFEMCEIPFDSSYLRSDTPERRNLGENDLYFGFQIALRSMCVGEKSRFLVDSKYAFGKLGVPPRIPPEAAILLEIEVFRSRSDKFEETKVEIEDLNKFQVAYGKAALAHKTAKDLFQKNDIKGAIREYRKAINLIENASLKDDIEQEQFMQMCKQLFTNLMTCHGRLGEYKKVCSTAHDFVRVNPKGASDTPKFFYQLAKAFLELGEYDKALRNISKASSLLPNDIDIRQLYEKIKNSKKQANLDERIMYRKALNLNEPTKQMTDEALKEFKESATKLIRSCKGSATPVKLTQMLTEEEKDIFVELCKGHDVELVREHVRGNVSYTLVDSAKA